MRFVPNRVVIALIEGFFVFAYNLEWFGGRYHTDGWFAFSWGFLPVLAGHVMQTNTVSVAALLMGLAMALFSLVEIKASRPYKLLKQRGPGLTEADRDQMMRFEAILKSISLGVIALGTGLALFRLFELKPFLFLPISRRIVPRVRSKFIESFERRSPILKRMPDVNGFKDYCSRYKPVLSQAVDWTLWKFFQELHVPLDETFRAMFRDGKLIRNSLVCLVNESLGGDLPSAIQPRNGSWTCPSVRRAGRPASLS